MPRRLLLPALPMFLAACAAAGQTPAPRATAAQAATIAIDRGGYARRMEGFWLGESVANWTGLVTEMDKIGGDGPHGRFYTREDWGKPDQPSIFDEGKPSPISPTIDFVLRRPGESWGADDDTDIEYIYQDALLKYATSVLTPQQIRQAWIDHIYDEKQPTPYGTDETGYQNYLWVSNQRAHELMLAGTLPPDTSDPRLNPHGDMIDAQLSTEIFGLFAPGRPDVALRMADLPIRTVARGEAADIARFHVVLHALSANVDPARPLGPQLRDIAAKASRVLPEGGYPLAMYRFVLGQYERGASWEEARDAVYRRYQLDMTDGYDISARGLYCNGCFAAGINFAAGLVSYFYGEGDLRETIRIGTLAGWDSDNPTATWGGLIGSIIGREGIEAAFGTPLSGTFYIHRTRKGFPNGGYDDFAAMGERSLAIVDRAVTEEAGGHIDRAANRWIIPLPQSYE
ncbi:ADP-ribosylglycohydrolase family protein [Sphingomonas sp. RS6]